MLELSIPEIQFAMQVVHEAALLMRQVQAELVSPALTKDDRSPVTVADFTSQALIGHLLEKVFPNDPLVAEEDSFALRQPSESHTLEQVVHFTGYFAPGSTKAEVCSWIDHARVDTASRFWTLDPIDGTKGFLRGDQYVVALALVVNGRVEVGALGCPKLTAAWQPDLDGPGSLVVAARGQGAWTIPLGQVQSWGKPGSFERLVVSDRKEAWQARILRSVEAGHTNVDQTESFAEALGVQVEPLRMDSQAKYAVLAAGKGELYLRLLSPAKPNYREKIWDQAAGSLILEEAGGRISDLDGRPLDFSTGRELLHNRGILASNGIVHQAALQALKDIHA